MTALFNETGPAGERFDAPVPLDAFLAGHGASRAVLLAPGDDPALLVPHLHNLALVAIAFPKFSDGRGHSIAVRLRRHLGFSGTLRAVGDILVDQVPHYFRSGFDEIAVTDAATIKRLSAGPHRPHARFAQPRPALSGPLDRGQGFAWRRVV